MNYFAHTTAAERYAASRPYVHGSIVTRIGKHIGIADPVPRALDVGCGTGQSARALLQLARSVIATDLSIGMLGQAASEQGISYAAARAEQLPFASGSFDLVTVALAFHWFNRGLSMPEARRVLKPEGWLVIYNSWNAGDMPENPEYEAWSHGAYMSRYPSPKRDRRPLEASDLAAWGLYLEGSERFATSVTFTPEQLVDYLTTQSTVIAAVEGGREPIESARKWLLNEVAPLFKTDTAAFNFGASVQYLRAVALQAKEAQTE